MAAGSFAGVTRVRVYLADLCKQERLQMKRRASAGKAVKKRKRAKRAGKAAMENQQVGKGMLVTEEKGGRDKR